MEWTEAFRESVIATVRCQVPLSTEEDLPRIVLISTILYHNKYIKKDLRCKDISRKWSDKVDFKGSNLLFRNKQTKEKKRKKTRS